MIPSTTLAGTALVWAVKPNANTLSIAAPMPRAGIEVSTARAACSTATVARTPQFVYATAFMIPDVRRRSTDAIATELARITMAARSASHGHRLPSDEQVVEDRIDGSAQVGEREDRAVGRTCRRSQRGILGVGVEAQPIYVARRAAAQCGHDAVVGQDVAEEVVVGPVLRVLADHMQRQEAGVHLALYPRAPPWGRVNLRTLLRHRASSAMSIDRQLSTHHQPAMAVKRLGRGIIRVHEHSDLIANPVARAQLGTLLRAGQAMEFAARLREQGERLTPGLALQFASVSGISAADLRLIVLPTLDSAGVVAYAYRDAALEAIEEYVGVTKPFLHQVVEVANQLGPSTGRTSRFG
jgi:hypothetical protein